MKTTLILMRHGETAWNAEGRWQGHYDISLNATGRAQAAAAAPFLTTAGFTRIVSSDLSRARETAEIINQTLRLPLILEPRLREIDVGFWQGMTSHEIRAQHAELYAQVAALPYYETYFPGGESRAQLMQRGSAALTELAAQYPTERLLVVSHGGTIRACLYHLAGVELTDHLENCALSCLIHENLAWRVAWVGLSADAIDWGSA